MGWGRKRTSLVKIGRLHRARRHQPRTHHRNVLNTDEGERHRESATMRPSPLSIGFLTVALATLPVSAASAQEFHHHYHHYGLVGGVFWLAGAVVVGASTI